MDKTQELERRIALLEKQIKDLQVSSSIPFNVIKAFEGAGFIKTAKPDRPPYTDWYLNDGFGYFTGGVYIQSMANDYLKINDGGRDLFIPLHQINETP